MDFLNLWFQVVKVGDLADLRPHSLLQAMTSDVFIDHLGDILEYVIPNMLNIAEVMIDSPYFPDSLVELYLGYP